MTFSTLIALYGAVDVDAGIDAVKLTGGQGANVSDAPAVIVQRDLQFRRHGVAIEHMRSDGDYQFFGSAPMISA